MSKNRRKAALKAVRSALGLVQLLDRFKMKDAPGAVTVFVNKKGKVIGRVFGQRPREGSKMLRNLRKQGEGE